MSSFGIQQAQVLVMKRHTIVILLKEPDLIKEQHNRFALVKHTEIGTQQDKDHVLKSFIIAMRFKIHMPTKDHEIIALVLITMIGVSWMKVHAIREPITALQSKVLLKDKEQQNYHALVQYSQYGVQMVLVHVVTILIFVDSKI